MKSIFEVSTQEEIIQRINGLTNSHQPLWGKMNAYQMAKHCSLCDDMMQGEIKIKRSFMGRLIGRMFLKKALQEGKNFGKNVPTAPILVTTSTSGDLETQKQEWIQKIKNYNTFNPQNFVHPFFGPMTKDEIGAFVYKHLDHHLRQFGL
jgi:hypothetical protein